MPARIASATRGPTPCTLSSVWNRLRSDVVENPYRRSGSSVTKCAWMCSCTSPGSSPALVAALGSTW